MEKKHITMIVQSIYPNDSRVRREAEALAKHNFDVTIICLRNKDQKFCESYNNIFVYRIQYKKNDESILKYLMQSLKFLFNSFFYTIKFLNNRKIDIVQVHNLPDYLIFATLILKLKRIPIILDLHDLSPELFKSKWSNRHKYLYKLVLNIEKWSCAWADHIITTSEGFKEKLIERGVDNKKISIIINYPSNFIKRVKSVYIKKIDENLKIIYHGTIAYRFGLHLIILAMPKILEKIPESIFHIYGGGDKKYIHFLLDLIKKLSLEGNVQIFPSLIHEEIIQKIQDYHIGVVPYLEDEFMQLALSTKSFEYAKLSIPMIASSLKPIKYYFDDDSIVYFTPGDIEDLTNKIIYLAKTENLMARVSKNAYKKVKKLLDENIEQKYVQIINKFIY